MMKMVRCSAGWPRSHHTAIEIKVDLYVRAICHVDNMAHTYKYWPLPHTSFECCSFCGQWCAHTDPHSK